MLRWTCRACNTAWEADSTPEECIRCDSALPPMFTDHDAEIADLRAQLAAREAEVTRLREVIADHDRRADAARDTADRRMRVNNLAARYAGGMAAMHMPVDHITADKWDWEYVVSHARALAEAVVAAEDAR